MIKIIPFSDVPVVSVNQMILIDRIMMEEYNIGLTQMMEQAGLNLATLAAKLFLLENPELQTIVVAGKGGNGAGALVAGRRLSNWGFSTSVILIDRASTFKPESIEQIKSLQRLGVSVVEANKGQSITFPKNSVILDGLLGYGLTGTPSGYYFELINKINDSKAAVLALDIPSGIELSTETIHSSSINAHSTLAVALPKRGMNSPQMKLKTGNLYLADIGIPKNVYARLGIIFKKPLFNGEYQIVQLI